MRIPRFFLDVPLVVGGEVSLSDPAAVHAVRVLRLRAGDPVSLFNGDGHEYPARLVAADARRAMARIEAARESTRESPLAITLAQALARGEKMDWIVQKATELGVAGIVPVITERSEVKLDPARAGKRVNRWRAVAISACEQSGRAVIPHVDVPSTLTKWLASIGPSEDGATRLVLHPDTSGARARARVPAALSMILAVGPEGGFGEDDLARLHGAGFDDLALGPRILRTETAGLAAIAALQALFGDL